MKAGAVALLGLLHMSAGDSTASHDDLSLCSLRPAGTLAVVRVEKDTLLTSERMPWQPSHSDTRFRAEDIMLARPTTPMPGARVRLLQLDSTTRAAFAANRIMDAQPVAYLHAAPYRADCESIIWMDTVPFVVPGEVGYVRAALAPREAWIDGAPVLIVRDAWNYPYPRRRSLAFRALPGETLASAEAMFSFNAALEMPRPTSREAAEAAEEEKRARVIAWARANPTAADLEPIRAEARRALLESDWRAVSSIPSRLRGSYRVDIDAGDKHATWFFRTHDRPGYSTAWPESTTIAQLLAAPFVYGYQLVGYYASVRDSLVTESPRLARELPFVGISTIDRPTTPGNESRRALPGFLDFYLAAAPESLWADLEPFVRKPTARDSALMARLKINVPRGRQQPRIPITLRLDAQGGARADTTLHAGGRSIRLRLERIDTTSVRRPWNSG